MSDANKCDICGKLYKSTFTENDKIRIGIRQNVYNRGAFTCTGLIYVQNVKNPY